MIKWRRTEQGNYESGTLYWDEKKAMHRPLYTIKKTATGFSLYVKDKVYIVERYYAELLDREIEITNFATLKYAKLKAESMEAEFNASRQTEEERGFAEGGGWSGATWITGDGKGGSWHKDKEGLIVEG